MMEIVCGLSKDKLKNNFFFKSETKKPAGHDLGTKFTLA